MSLAFHAGKFQQRILNDRIRRLDFLNTDAEQYGFIKGRSAMNSLFHLIHNLKMKIKTKSFLMPLYVTWRKRKAFDLVDIDLFFYCFLKKGKSGKIVLLNKNLLKTGEVSFRVKDIRVFSFTPSTGVPHGVLHYLCSSKFFSRVSLKQSIIMLMTLPVSAVPVTESYALTLLKTFTGIGDL